MKLPSLLAGALVLASIVTPSARAVTILDPAYSYSPYHTHSISSSSISSFDWSGGGDLYYQTSTSFFTFGGLFRWDGIAESTAVGASADFAGASALSIGDFIYYNTSDFTDQKIFKYGPLAGSPVVSSVSTAANFGLYRRNPGEIFITGAIGFGTNEVFYTTVDLAGNFASAPFSLGVTIGGSGPVGFDSAGNMYYAPGFGDLKIYKYTAADVAAAIADPILNPLPAAASRLWRDYSGDFGLVTGAAGLAFDSNGNLVVSLTDFSNPSYLVRFDVDMTGAYSGHSAILSSSSRLGDVRTQGGSIFLANENTVLQVVPEPTVTGLSFLGAAIVAFSRRRRVS